VWNSDESDRKAHPSPLILRSGKVLRGIRVTAPSCAVYTSEEEVPDTAANEAEEAPEEQDEAVLSPQEDPEPDDEPSGISASVFEEECRKAYQKGVEEGQKTGIKIGKAETQSALKLLNTLSQELGDAQEQLFGQAEEMVVKLACSIARQVIYREVETDPDVIVGAVKQALSYVKEAVKPVIKMNPTDYEHLNACRGELLASSEGIGSLTFEMDERIERGGCVVETESGTVDGRLDLRYERVERVLLEEIGNA